MLLKNCARILVVRTDRMGDVVLTTPVFKALRSAFPKASISVMLRQATKDLVEGNPYVDTILIDDRDGAHQGFVGALKLAREIRKGAYDAVFIFHTKRRYNIACFLAGIPVRVGFKNDKWGCLLTHPVKDQRASGIKHEVNYCLDVLQSVGITDIVPEIFIPISKDAQEWAIKWFEQQHIKAGELIVIHPGASDQTKIWPAKCFAELINVLQQRYEYKILLVGGKETAVIARDIKSQISGNVYDLCGEIDISQLASILRYSRVLVSNDSGPVHVASGVGIHVISLFLRDQPGINPQRWGPFGPKGFVISNKSEEAVKLDAKSKILSGKMDSISVSSVLKVIESILYAEHQRVFYW